MFREWSLWSRSLGATTGDDADAPDEVDEGCTSFPEGAIRLHYINRGWIPLGMGDGSSNYFGVDLDPGPDGVVGQVINFGRDEEAKYVLARAWAQFLEDFADELEAGNYTIRLEKISKKSKRVPEKIFEMNTSRPGSIPRNLKAWSEAKMAPYDTKS